MDISCSLNVTHCPLCQQAHERSVPFNRCVEHGVTWRYHLCRDCGLVYQSPQMTDEELSRFYSADYWKTQGQSVRPDAEQTALQTGRAQHLLSQVPADHEVKRFLDIGCAAGFILREARNRFACDVVGVELSDPFRKFCQDDGLQVYASTEALLAAGEARFDCITMSHVLEHIRRPIEFLEQLRTNLLQPNGLFVLEVPNLYAHKSFEPAHPICFSEKTLRATLTAAGFETQSLLIHNHPRQEVARPLYISAVAAPLALKPGEPKPTLRFDRPSPLLERVKRALKGARIGVTSLFQNDLEY
jgi:2-polyprenyl-3-methyl-5-hydroxy-6-metoxy-1,4-benzoquinol methylase